MVLLKIVELVLLSKCLTLTFLAENSTFYDIQFIFC